MLLYSAFIVTNGQWTAIDTQTMLKRLNAPTLAPEQTREITRPGLTKWRASRMIRSARSMAGQLGPLRSISAGTHCYNTVLRVVGQVAIKRLSRATTSLPCCRKQYIVHYDWKAGAVREQDESKRHQRVYNAVTSFPPSPVRTCCGR